MKLFKKIQKSSIILITIFVLLSLVSSFFPAGWNYGFNHLTHFSISVRIILSLIVFLTFFPRINSFFVNKIKSSFSSFFKKFPKTNKYLYFILISIIFFIIFWNLKSVRLYGDATETIERLDKGTFLMTNVLTDYVYKGTSSITSIFDFNSYLTIAFASCLAGAVFIFFILLISDELGKKLLDKIFIFSLVSTMGSLALFFGHIEVYSFQALGITIYIYTSILYLRNKCSIIWPSFVLSLTFLCHMSSGVLLPSLLALHFVKRKERSLKESFLKKYFFNNNLFKLTAYFFIPIVILLFAVYALEWNFQIPKDPVTKYGRFAQPWEGFWGGFYPLRTIKHPDPQRFTLFSIGHMNEQFNEHMLISAIGIILLFIIFFNKEININYKEPLNIFFLTLILFYFLYTFVRALSFGPNDWDHFAPISITYTLFGSYLFTKYETKEKIKGYVYLTLLTASLFHLLPWILFNANRLF